MATKRGKPFPKNIDYGPGDRTTAFSLVEVVIAIGIVSFAILAILGVLSVGMQSSRESSEDTVLGLAAEQVNAWSRSQTFSNLSASVSASSPTLLFFDIGGSLMRTSDGSPLTAPGADSHYSCTISVHASGISPHLLHLQYRFEWPLAAPLSARRQRIVVASRFNEN